MPKYLTTPTGEQVVVIDNKFAFAWSGKPPLQAGELVVLPGRAPGSHWRGTVTDFGTDFVGILKMVIERVVPVARGPIISDVEAARMKKDYEKGMSIRDIADKYDRSFGGVRSALLRTDTTLRKRGGNNRVG